MGQFKNAAGAFSLQIVGKNLCEKNVRHVKSDTFLNPEFPDKGFCMCIITITITATTTIYDYQHNSYNNNYYFYYYCHYNYLILLLLLPSPPSSIMSRERMVLITSLFFL